MNQLVRSPRLLLVFGCALLAGAGPLENQQPSVGCNIKWKRAA